MVVSQAVEDYLKTIYKLESTEKNVSTKQLADALKVSAASVTNMIKRMSNMGLVHYESYKGTRLTHSGKKIALEIIRHHRLLELYLLEIMGYSWDEVHEEAEHLEHHISEQFEEKIAELLGNPTHDPHGDPIPTKDGLMPDVKEIPLTEAAENHPYVIGRVLDQDPERLRYFEKEGLIPGVRLIIREKAPLEGPITVVLEGEKEKVIGQNVAKSLLLKEWPENSPTENSE